MGVAVALNLDADDALRQRAIAGDEVAFDAVLRPLIGPGLRLARSMLGDRRDAEDATQEAVTKAWRKLHQLRPGRPVRPWFLAIVANQCRSIRRTRWFRLTSLTGVIQRAPVGEPSLEHLDLERCLASLPMVDRQALFLRFYLDLPIDEVAVTLGVSPPAAKARIFRACRRLRPALTEEDI